MPPLPWKVCAKFVGVSLVLKDPKFANPLLDFLLYDVLAFSKNALVTNYLVYCRNYPDHPHASACGPGFETLFVATKRACGSTYQEAALQQFIHIQSTKPKTQTHKESFVARLGQAGLQPKGCGGDGSAGRPAAERA